MLRVGLTGGIGAGKSEVARRLADHGAVVIDADVLAREVVAPGTDGLREVVAAFGEQVLDHSGALDRAAMAAAVFDDPAARRRLESIIHPRVRERTAALTAAAPADAVVVHDVPLLVEVGLAPTYHLVIVVTAGRDTRVDRLVHHRGMTAEQARARITSQADDDVRAAAADVLLSNDGTRAQLHSEVDLLWRDRLREFEANLHAGRAARAPQPVRLVPPDPGWPAAYQRLADRLRQAVGEHRIDHIGSTAVGDLPAKDVIDIQLAVPDLATADALADPLAAAGFPPLPGVWHDLPPKPEPPEPKRVHAAADPGRPVNLHVRRADASGWRRALLMRDWLRADPASRDEYAAHKRQLTAGGLDRDAYAEAKQPWFDRAWAQAERWARDTGWRPGP